MLERKGLISSLTDLAASSTQAAHVAKGTDKTTEDEDDPSHCNFFQASTCKYANATFKPPSATHWIGCDFPECGRWYHESCLGPMSHVLDLSKIRIQLGKAKICLCVQIAQ